MFLGCLLLLFLTTGLGMIAEGSFDFIYVIIIGILAIICPAMSYIILYNGGREMLLSCAFLILITIAEFITAIFLSSKFIITHNAKRIRKIIGYIINIISTCCILSIIIRSLMVIF